MKLTRTWVAIAIALSCCAITAHAAIKPTVADIETRLLDEGRKSTTGGWVGPVPIGVDNRDVLMDFWKQLFQDPQFIAATEKWLLGRQFDSSDELFREWVGEFGRLAAAGLNHWTDEEIDGYLRSPLYQATIVNRDVCVKLNAAKGPPTPEMVRQIAIPRGDVATFLRTIKRTYLAALANQVPRPAATDSQIETASLRLLMAMPENERERYLELSNQTQLTVTAEGACDMAAIHLKAMLSLAGESGKVMRRSYFVMVASQALAPQRVAGPAKVRNAASGQFQPGAASLHYPPLATRAGIEGWVKMAISVNEQGLATRVRTVEASFNKPSLLVDGKDVPSWQLFEPVTAVFYQAGRFMQRYEQGKPVAYEAEVEMRWRLDDERSRAYKEAIAAVGKGKTLAVTVPADWEEKVVDKKPLTMLQLNAPKISVALTALPSKTPQGETVTLQMVRPALDEIVNRLQPTCVERDARLTAFAPADGEGMWLFCTDKNHKPADPRDYKYSHTGIVKVDDTYVIFAYQSNEEGATVRSKSQALLKTIRFYTTVYPSNP